MEKQPSFITYTALQPASHAERLAAAATAFFNPENSEVGAWAAFRITPTGLCTKMLSWCVTEPPYFMCVYAEVNDRGQGPELVMEFYNCGPSEDMVNRVLV